MKISKFTFSILTCLAIGVSANAFSQELLSCATYSIDSTVASADDTNGDYPAVVPGDVFTFQMTPEGDGAATTASWRIVNDPTGDPGSTLVPGGTVSGTLVYTVTVAEPSGTGIGFYVDSIDGTARVVGSCAPAQGPPAAARPAAPVPAMSTWGMGILALLLAAVGLIGLHRRLSA